MLSSFGKDKNHYKLFQFAKIINELFLATFLWHLPKIKKMQLLNYFTIKT